MWSYRIFLLWMSLCLSFTIRAEDLKQIYALAVTNDAILLGAYDALQAHRQAFPEALARMAPNLSANYQSTGTDNSSPIFGDYNTKNYGLTLTQPLFHPEQWAELERSRHIVKGATAAYLDAAQTLIIRVATAYFNVLSATDDLTAVGAQRKAFDRELEQTRQRFEVGLIAITDVQDAKARYDVSVANEIEAKNNLFDQYEELRVIVGVPIKQVTLFPITQSFSLLPPCPKNEEAWVANTHQFNLSVLTAKETAEQQKAAIGIQASGHFPKIDIQGSLQKSRGAPPFPFDELNFTRSVTINIAVPIFEGGGTIFRTKEARALYQQSLEELEETQRVADSNTRQAYRGVLTAISRIEALAQAVVSNKTALEATKAAYEVGTRTIVDVLNAETRLIDAENEHAKARYTYLLEGLKLKQSAGTLAMDDLLAVNAIIIGTAKAATITPGADQIIYK